MATEHTVVGRSGYVDGPVRLHHLEYGDPGSAPVVIIPGITTPAGMLEFLSTDLARDYRVVTLDVRGRGFSDKPADGFTLDDYADDVAAVIRALGLERPALVGHSMGARIAAAAAVRYPDLVGPSVLADPPLTGTGTRADYPMSLDAFMTQLDVANSGGGADGAAPVLPDADRGAARRPRRVAAHLRGERRPGDVAELPSRGLPQSCWLSCGRRCCSCTAPRARWSPRRRCPRSGRPPPTGSSSFAISGAGHMIPWDNTADFLAETRRFLAAAR